MRAALTLLSFFFCASASADILVGVAGPMAGQNGVFGQQMKAGAEAAVADINAAGGINGEPLALQIADDGCDARTAAGIAQDFANRDVRMVAGHFCTGAAIAAGAIYDDRKIIMISPSATLPRLTENGRRFTFRAVSRDDSQADIAVARMKKDNAAAKIALVTDGSPASKPVAERFLALSSATAFTFKPGSLDAVTLARDIRSKGFDTIYFACNGGDAGRLVQTMRRLEWQPAFYGSDQLLVDEFWEKAGPAGEGTLVTFAVDHASLPEAVTIAPRLKSESIAVITYAAIEAFAAAARAKSVNDASAIADYLRTTDIPTAIGKIGFDAKGDVRPQRFSWYRWSEGSYAEDKQ